MLMVCIYIENGYVQLSLHRFKSVSLLFYLLSNEFIFMQSEACAT